MANIIKRNSPSVRTVTVPDGYARTSIITINQQGFINSIRSGRQNGNDFVSTQYVAMGYEGDNNVTLIKIELDFDFNQSGDFFDRYDARLIIENAQKQKFTLSLNNNEVLLPRRVSSDGKSLDLTVEGTYTMHYVISEKMDSSVVTGGHVGDEDVELFREIFVSDDFSGKVEPSGYALCKDGDGNHQWVLYDYDLINLSSDSLTNILSGCNLTTTDDIVFNPDALDKAKINIYVDDIPNNIGATYDPNSKTLNITGEGVKGKTFTIIYPVTFQPIYPDKTTHKPVIELLWTPGSRENLTHKQGTFATSYLGIKNDSYVTAIDLSNILENLHNGTQSMINASNVESYVVFSGEINGELNTFVCPTYQSTFESKQHYLCWVPLEVTRNPGSWKLSPVIRQGDGAYTFYHGIITLPVVNSFIELADLVANHDVVELYDSAQYILTDKTNTKLYVYNDGSDYPGKINDYTAAQIEQNLDFVRVLMNSYADPESIVKILQASSGGDYLTELERRVTTIEGDSTVKGSIKYEVAQEAILRDNADKALDDRIVKIENKKLQDSAYYAKASDVESLSDKVDDLTEAVGQIQGTDLPSTYATKGELKQVDNKIDALTASGGRIDLLEDRVATLDTPDTGVIAQLTKRVDSLDNQATGEIVKIKTRLTTNETDIDKVENDIDQINSTLITINEFIESHDSVVDKLQQSIIAEAGLRGAADQKLQTNIDNIYALDETTAQESGVLVDKINVINNFITDHEGRISTTEKSLDILNGDQNTPGSLSHLEQNINSQIIDINGTLNQHNNWIDSTEQITLQNQIDIATIKQGGYITNEYDPANIMKTIVASIVFITPDVVNNKTAEDVYNDMVAAGAIDANTLYLIQEEE